MTEHPDMRIKALVPWFGGKRTLAPAIVAELGPHSSYFEPFCGSMAVLLAKPASSHENVNDLHGDLINLARCIQDGRLGPTLYRRLRRTLSHEALHAEARERIGATEWEGHPDGERAYWYFLLSWMSRNGVAGTTGANATYARRWTPYGGHGGSRFEAAVRSIPAWRRRIRKVSILRMDGFAFIERITDAPRTSIYADPPYLAKGAQYLHDFPADDHRRLRDLLAAFRRARVVVSYYDCPAIRELYAGWTVVEHPRQKNLARQNGTGTCQGEAPEILLLNGPSYARPADAPLLQETRPCP